MTDPDTGDTGSVNAAPEQPGVLRREPVLRHQVQRLHGRVLPVDVRQPGDHGRRYAGRSQQHRQHRHSRGLQVRARERRDPGVDRRHDPQQQSDGVGPVEQHAGMGLSRITSSPLAPTPDAATHDRRWARAAGGRPRCLRFWQKSIYLEFANYRTANVLANAFRRGLPFNEPGGVFAVYESTTRTGVSRTRTTGVPIRSWSAPPAWSRTSIRTISTRIRRPIAIRDVAVDAQYQYITDVHTVTAQATYIWENQSYNASYPITQETGAGYGAGPTPSNPTDSLRTFRIKGSYYYERKYGATLGVLPDDGQRRRRPIRDHGQRRSQHAQQQRLRRRARLPSTPERPPAVAVHGLWEVQRGKEQLRRHRTQHQRQQHAVLRRLGRILTAGERGSKPRAALTGQSDERIRPPTSAWRWQALFARDAQNPAPGPTRRTPGEEQAVNLCSTCHGPRGISTSPEFPILAAQRPAYLVAQIENFQHKTREEKAAHDFMYGIAGNSRSQAGPSIAAYYAAQPPARGRPGDPAQIAMGKKLFETGLPDRGVPPCASCHGAERKASRTFRVLRASMRST